MEQTPMAGPSPFDMSDEAARSALARLRFRPIAERTDQSHQSAEAVRLVEAFRAVMTNGDALVDTFHLDGLDAEGVRLLTHGRSAFPVPEALLDSATLRDRRPELVEVDDDFPSERDFHPGDPMTLAGEIARLLADGGAHGRFVGRSAYPVADAFRVSLFGDRYDDVLVWCSATAWSTWFHDIAWDRTWIVLDLPSRTLTLLCVTDED